MAHSPVLARDFWLTSNVCLPAGERVSCHKSCHKHYWKTGLTHCSEAALLPRRGALDVKLVDGRHERAPGRGVELGDFLIQPGDL